MEIHDSRDETQRLVTLTYHNVKKNKDGEWIGKPVRVDRSINDLILVDNALNEAMLNTNKLKERMKDEEDHQKMEIKSKNDGAKDENGETINICDDLVEADIASENGTIESKDETDKSEDESVETPDATYESKGENVGMPEDNEK